MATIALSAVGTYFGGPVGGRIGAMVGSYIDQAIFSKGQKLPDRVIGARLDELQVQSSTYGKMLPIVYGRQRMAGNVIWSTNIREVETRTSSGGGKGGPSSPKQTSISYQYYVTLAIAICEGEIDSIEKVWADTKLLTAKELQASNGKYNIYKGSENQLPDDIMEANLGIGNVPAYRGVAYVVIEDFSLAAFGNRIPNFTFEVKRTLKNPDAVENKIKEICLIPGAGEFVYHTETQEKIYGYDLAGKWIQSGPKEIINENNTSSKADILASLDDLESTFPNLEYISIICAWFADSLDAGTCTILPRVEYKQGTISSPDRWNVAGFTRSNTPEVTKDNQGNPIYGGTPSDESIVKLLDELRSRGYKIMFYPFVFVDTANKEWRGRITASANQISNFFSGTNKYNNFINHYANLVKDKVDSFVIGSEMVGLTQVEDDNGNFPAVDEFVSLLASVRNIMGNDVKLTYASNWDEYHSVNGKYNMDKLWADPNLDILSIDAYFPLTDDLEQSHITEEVIKQGWESGEGWDYFYTDAEERTGKTNYASPEFAWKNLEYWWKHSHINPDGSETLWSPKLKPVWFTEYGFASVDGCTNQPNLFIDNSSAESAFPRGSKERVDFLAQQQAINATLDYLTERNSVAGNEGLVPRSFLWTWDGRPYPFFPDLKSVWRDSDNWKYGHWVQGKLGITLLDKVLEDLLIKVGLSSGDIDLSQIKDVLEGYALNERQTIRDAINMMATGYFFNAVESSGKIKFIPKGKESEVTIYKENIIPQINDNIRIISSKTRRPDLELPKRVDVSYINRVANYNLGTQTALRQVTNAVDQISVNIPIVFGDRVGKQVADKSLYSSWVNRNIHNLTIKPKYQYLDPGDVITYSDENNVDHMIRITSINYSGFGAIEIEGVSEDISTYDFYIEPGETLTDEEKVNLIPDTRLIILDLPLLPNDSETGGIIRFAVAGEGKNWNSASIYSSNDGGEEGGNNFNRILDISEQAVIGNIINTPKIADINNFDNASELEVILLSGELNSVSELSLLNGANVAVIGGEIIQFQNAELIGENRYKLTKLLRGRLGTETEIASHQPGEIFVLLDSAIIKQDINSYNLPRHYKAVTAGNTLAETSEQEFTYTARCLKPYAPTHIIEARDINGNINISWVRRTRSNGEYRDYADIPIGEEAESYEIDVLNNQNEVVRTISANTTNVTYTATDQISDFGSIQDSLEVKIYQISASIGRGYGSVANI